jgi:TonB-linked SusC/RagA family outer membrane protein
MNLFLNCFSASTLSGDSYFPPPGAPGRAGGLKLKLLLIMKFTAIFMLVTALQLSARTYSQRISLSEKNAKLEKVFAAIKAQTGYVFFYDQGLMAQARPVTIKVKDAPLETVLKICFEDQPFTYSIVGTTIVVKSKPTVDLQSAVNSPDESLPVVSSIPQPIDITGRVTDADGNPLAGASVKVKGTSIGTTTNNNGEFQLTGINEDAVMVISYVGYETIELAANNPRFKPGVTSPIALKLKPENLNEVIINKGYYTEKQKTSVSNTVKITAAVIEKQPVQNLLLALQARVPGLFVTQGSGNAGGNLKVRIQGENSMLNGNDPLYVVDGVPIDAQLPVTGIDGRLGNGSFAGTLASYGNPLNYLNPLDIESIEILKDADATAIYGSRAANGAILITTKKGKAGAMKFDLNMETGWGKMTRRVDMMDTRQYLDMRYEAFANDGINWRDPSVSVTDLKLWDTTRYTNWQDELLSGTAKYNNINASVSGGSANMRYLISGTYHKETTVFPLPKDFADQKASVHFNINATSNNQKMKMQFSGNYMFDNNQLSQADFTQTAVLLEPHAPKLLNADGSINWAQDANGNSTLATQGNSTKANPLTQRYLKYVNKTHNLVSSLRLDYTIIPGLTIGSSFGYNYMQTNDFSPNPLIAVAPELRATTKRGASFGDRNIQSWIIEPQGGYHTKIKKGTLDLLIGSTFQNKQALSYSIYGEGQLSDELLDNINAAANIYKGYSTVSNYRYNALFGRANFNWEDKYILSVNARRDGSTRFGADNRFHNFGSIGAAWLFSNETFFKRNFNFISFGKIRGNYGTTGSDQIGDYRFMSLYDFVSPSSPYQGIVGLLPAGLPNSELEWEETKKLQLGIDLGFLQDKLVVNANYVQNRSSNQLMYYPLPYTAGFPSYLLNFPATVQNRNWELMVTGKIVQNKNLTWTSSINLTIPKNTLLKFPGLSDSSYNWKVGYPIDALPQLHWMGVAAGTGEYLYADKDGHLTISPGADDLNVRISKYPQFYGGFQNSISFKSIQLDFIFQFVKQNGYNDIAIWNGSFRTPGMFAAGNSNQPVTLLDRWQKTGDQATVAKYSTYLNPDAVGSDRRFTDITYVSLKNVSLSYELPQKWVSKANFRSFRIYTHGQNLFTITKYKGLNPETQSMTSLPPLTVWTVGIQAGL